MATEYYAVVCEFSPRSISVGFAGEAVPSVFLRSGSPLWQEYRPSPEKDIIPRLFDVSSHSLTPKQREDILGSLKNHPVENAVLKRYQADAAAGNFVFWEKDGFRALGRLMKHIITKELMVTPRNVKLMVLDDNYSAVEKVQLCKALIGPAGCSHSVYFIPRAPCISMSGSVEDSVVVDFSWAECRVSVLGELRVVGETRMVDLGEEVISYKLIREKSDVTVDTVAEAVGENVPLVLSELPGAIARLVAGVAVDLRPKALENIVFCSSVVPLGAQRELLKQVQQLLPKTRVSGKHCLGAWAGASIYCSTTLAKHDSGQLREREVTAEKLASGAWKRTIIG